MNDKAPPVTFNERKQQVLRDFFEAAPMPLTDRYWNDTEYHALAHRAAALVVVLVPKR